MALRNIRHDGDPVLRKRSKEVPEVNTRIKDLAEDMLETMYKANGVGLAAPQVGILKRVIVVDVGVETPEPHVFINPEIFDEEGNDRSTEGCLSVPGVVGYVDRPVKIKVKSLNLEGEEVITEAEDFFARAICHEVDHLNGVLFIDKEDYEEADMDEEEEE